MIHAISLGLFEFANLELDSTTLKVTRWPRQEYMVKRILWGVVSGWWLMFALQNFSLPRSALCGAHGRCDHRGTLAPTATIDGAGVWTWYTPPRWWRFTEKNDHEPVDFQWFSWVSRSPHFEPKLWKPFSAKRGLGFGNGYTSGWFHPVVNLWMWPAGD